MRISAPSSFAHSTWLGRARERVRAVREGLPREKAFHPDTLPVWEMNGEPITHAHGGPIRLVVPGWVGVWWVKWITEIFSTDEEFSDFWQHERYRYVGGDFDEPEDGASSCPGH